MLIILNFPFAKHKNVQLKNNFSYNLSENFLEILFLIVLLFSQRSPALRAVGSGLYEPEAGA
jgi:hypothetical protein